MERGKKTHCVDAVQQADNGVEDLKLCALEVANKEH